MADPGMGKTTLLELLALRIGRKLGSMTNEASLLRIDFSSLVDAHKLGGEFLRAIGHPGIPGRTNLDVMTRMIDTGLDQQRPAGAFFDEAQHMCEGCRDITASALADWIKLRMDKHCLMMILSGTPTLARMRTINSQLLSRIAADYVIKAFQYGTSWHQLLAGLNEQVKSIDLQIILDKKVAKPVFDGSQGNLRRLKQWLSASSHCCASDGRKALTVEDLGKGYDRAFGTNSPIPNPFKETR